MFAAKLFTKCLFSGYFIKKKEWNYMQMNRLCRVHKCFCKSENSISQKSCGIETLCSLDSIPLIRYQIFRLMVSKITLCLFVSVKGHVYAFCCLTWCGVNWFSIIKVYGNTFFQLYFIVSLLRLVWLHKRLFPQFDFLPRPEIRRQWTRFSFSTTTLNTSCL